jgi:hypothetical protein
MENAHPVLSKDAMHKQELDMLIARKSKERQEIYNTLKERKWFQETDPELQKKLLDLPDKGRENHDGFLKDLAQRPEVISNVKVERMIDLPRGSFALLPKFEVSRVDNPAVRYTYEYASWRNGPMSGEKGVVFVEKNGEATHFIVLHGDKFATGKKGFDSVGGFADLGSDGVSTINERTLKEMEEELGVKDIKLKRKIELGRVNTDVGMTNNEPGIFAAFVDASDAEKIPTNHVNGDIYELKSGAVVFPMSELPKVVMANSDSLFLSAIARSWASGAIALPQSVIGKSVAI